MTKTEIAGKLPNLKCLVIEEMAGIVGIKVRGCLQVASAGVEVQECSKPSRKALSAPQVLAPDVRNSEKQRMAETTRFT